MKLLAKISRLHYSYHWTTWKVTPNPKKFSNWIDYLFLCNIFEQWVFI